MTILVVFLILVVLTIIVCNLPIGGDIDTGDGCCAGCLIWLLLLSVWLVWAVWVGWFLLTYYDIVEVLPK